MVLYASQSPSARVQSTEHSLQRTAMARGEGPPPPAAPWAVAYWGAANTRGASIQQGTYRTTQHRPAQQRAKTECGFVCCPYEDRRERAEHHSPTRSNQVEPTKTNPPSHQLGPSAAYGCALIGHGHRWSVPLLHPSPVEHSTASADSSLVGVATSAKVVLPPICPPLLHLRLPLSSAIPPLLYDGARISHQPKLAQSKSTNEGCRWQRTSPAPGRQTGTAR